MDYLTGAVDTEIDNNEINPSLLLCRKSLNQVNQSYNDFLVFIFSIKVRDFLVFQSSGYYKLRTIKMYCLNHIL